MKLKGGYDIPLKGRPADRVDMLPAPNVLHIPLWSRRFEFSEIAVEQGQTVTAGDVLARDPDNYFIPLLAPRGGTVNLEVHERHITLEDVVKEPPEAISEETIVQRAPESLESASTLVKTLVELGAWQYLCEPYSGDLPSPTQPPRTVIVSTLNLEPFVARGDVQLHSHKAAFMRALERLQPLIEYAPIYVVLPDVESELAASLHDELRGAAWVQTVTVTSRYPFGNLELLARKLDLRPPEEGPMWGMGTEGVLAIDRALTQSKPCDARLLTVGGPAAETEPRHVTAMSGYPIEKLVGAEDESQKHRVINGGVLTGSALPEEQYGVDTECCGLTILFEREKREFLNWARPGTDRQSFSNAVVGSLRRRFKEDKSTGLGGERRPCVACTYCAQVCPAEIRPNQIHRYLYRDALEEVEAARVDLCIGCGLCSYVCPSKIELRQQMLDAQERVQRELHPEEAAE